MLHGFTGTPDSFSALRAPPGAVTPILGGHLGTPVTGNFDAEVERLAVLGADCSGLLGYSLGGRLALGLLARYPDRFTHAVIVSAQAGLTSDDERARRRAGDGRLVALLREQGLESFVDHWQALPLWASQGALPEPLRSAQRQQRLRHTAEGLAQSLLRHGLGEMPDLRQELALLRTRVDLVAGERDEKFAALALELLGTIPGARLRLAPEAGHNLLLERPELCSELLSQGNPS